MQVMVLTAVHHPQDARILHRQIAALLAAGHGVTYAAPWSATGSEPPDVRGLQPLDLPRAQGRRRLPALRAVRTLLRRHGRQADVVLLHDPELLTVLAGLSLPPTVWDVHEDTAGALEDKRWLPGPSRGLTRAMVRAAEGVAERHLHLLLAEEGYRARFRLPHPVVPNDTTVPAAPGEPRGDRVVHLGRLSAGRGVADLLTLPALLPRGTRLELIGPADPEVAGDLGRAAAAGLLDWHGFVPNDRATARLAGALAGLSLLQDRPNYRHSRPTKVVEYMAAGVPVITTPTPVAAEAVTRHRCGLLVPYGDAVAVAGAVRTLRDDPGLRRGLGRRGHSAAQSFYDWRRSGPMFVAHLEGWAGARREPGRAARGTAGLHEAAP